MATPKNYGELVKIAETAVNGINDSELKKVAFQTVLEDLLSGTPKDKHQKQSRKVDIDLRKSHRKTPRSGPQAYVEELVVENFFEIPKTIGEVKSELELRGRHIPLTSLSGPMQKLCQRKQLRRQAVDTGGKKIYSYSNW